MNYYIGVDLGGTNIKAGVVDMDNGRVIATKGTETLADQGPEAVLQRIADLVLALASELGQDINTFGGVGVSFPGLLDLEKGETVFLTNFRTHWINVPVRSILEDRLHIPVFMLNDVRAITYGEWAFGAGRGAHNLICVAIGTGVGGGVVVNDELLLNLGGTTGELGHITIDINGERCGCGGIGCVETLAAGPAIANMGKKAVREGQETLLKELSGNDLSKITPRLISEAAEMGDEVSKQIWESAGTYLGIAITNAALVVGPDKVVVTGGVAAAGDRLLDPIRRTLKNRTQVIPGEKIEVVPGKLGDEAGIIGMAVWAAHDGDLADELPWKKI